MATMREPCLCTVRAAAFVISQNCYCVRQLIELLYSVFLKRIVGVSPASGGFAWGQLQSCDCVATVCYITRGRVEPDLRECEIDMRRIKKA